MANEKIEHTPPSAPLSRGELLAGTGNDRVGIKQRIVTCVLVPVMVLALVLAVFGAYLLAPLKGEVRGYYWNEFTPFSLAHGQSIDVGGEDYNILLLTDFHYPLSGAKTDALIKTMVEENNPDLIVLVGDQVFSPFNHFSYRHLINLFDSFKVPWAPVFGNHDEEGKADKQYLANMLEESEYCMFQYGPRITGAGNYFINLTNGADIIYTLFFLDSFSSFWESGYRPYTADQVSWLKWAASGIAAEAGKKVPSVVYGHIPVPEFTPAFNEAFASGTVIHGQQLEPNGHSNINNGLFAAIKDIGAEYMFCGHEHVNDFMVEYQGVKLAYVLSGGVGGYGNILGGTMFTVKPDASTTVVNKPY
ncbi:MAG: metallophosphoesterase [Firmicutes bacterium]|nr:metallophosphoesterase [Bacillota bacterium]